MSDLTGKHAFITGGGTGIGRATAMAFGKEGAKVVIGNRSEKNGLAAVEEIKKAGGDAIFVQTDVTQEADVARLIATGVKTYGRIDVAFNNAGTEGAGTLAANETVENYRTVFDANVLGVLLSLKHELRQFHAQGGGGAIINNASIAGSIGMAGGSVYIASKHAVLGLTRSAALEVAKEKIRINAVSPAAIETEMIHRFTGHDKDNYEWLKSLHPIGRVGQPEEIARAVLFLASDEASFITGHDLKVDGGFTVP